MDTEIKSVCNHCGATNKEIRCNGLIYCLNCKSLDEICVEIKPTYYIKNKIPLSGNIETFEFSKYNNIMLGPFGYKIIKRKYEWK
jgi:hypothetical protein